MEAVVAALAASIVSFAVLYILLERRIRKRVDPETILAQIRREIEGLIVELNQTADRSLTLMEEKMATIRNVLGEAEKRVAVLRREAKALEQTERAYASLRPAPVEALVLGSSVPAVARTARAPRKSARGRARTVRQKAPLAAASAVAASAVDPSDLRSRIVSLYRAGISADSIVRRLGAPRATVDLVVNLEDTAQAGGESRP